MPSRIRIIVKSYKWNSCSHHQFTTTTFADATKCKVTNKLSVYTEYISTHSAYKYICTYNLNFLKTRGKSIKCYNISEYKCTHPSLYCQTRATPSLQARRINEVFFTVRCHFSTFLFLIQDGPSLTVSRQPTPMISINPNNYKFTIYYHPLTFKHGQYKSKWQHKRFTDINCQVPRNPQDNSKVTYLRVYYANVRIIAAS